MFQNPVAGIIRPPGSPAILGSFRVTATFADHVARKPPVHGVDIGNGRCYDNLYAPCTGIVSFSGLIGAAKVIRIVPDANPDFEIALAHCELLIYKQGWRVTVGAKVGTLGQTGTTACHCHIGLKHKGVEIDVWPYLFQNITSTEVEVLKGTFVAAVNNRKALVIGSGTRLRAAPATGDTPILATYDTGDVFCPSFKVVGQLVGSSSYWYGGWMITAKGREFGYLHESLIGVLSPIEAIGYTEVQLQAAIKNARIAGISAAAAAAAMVK